MDSFKIARALAGAVSARWKRDDIQSCNNGVLKNGAAFAARLAGQAFSLDGANDFVEAPQNSI